MDYSRRDFLRVAAAGLPVVCAPWFCPGVAHATAKTHRAYGQARADRIHDRSTEEAIRQAGKDPAAVKAQVRRRLLELKAHPSR